MKRVVQLPNFSPKVNWFLTTFCLAAAFSKLPCGFAVFGQLRTQMFKFFFRTGFLPLSPQAIVGAFWGAFDRQGRRHSCPPPSRGGHECLENGESKMENGKAPDAPRPFAPPCRAEASAKAGHALRITLSKLAHRREASWSAVAERSGDTAFAPPVPLRDASPGIARVSREMLKR
jgi:hypothetical protein